ncbi:porin family protein [Thalassotalea litorea]|uniref:Porin family protein n=1 Tax=Thalassotalea litorea TaxID=2020715 RepID=A0A5R9IG27_9GAMM|nr:outer membrane beta-barrel protein [Thalassotalea litorea]TLU64242.1 porin family protein [Thalassotalea litorea]
MTIKIAMAVVLILSASSVQAADSIRWNAISASYQSVDVLDETLTGYGLSFTKQLLDTNAFFLGSATDVSKEFDQFDAELQFNTYNFGFGYKNTITNSLDFYGTITFEKAEAESQVGIIKSTTSENGFGLSAGVRWLLIESIELGGSIGYIEVDRKPSTGLNVSALFHISDSISLGAGYSVAEDVNSYSASAMWFF